MRPEWITAADAAVLVGCHPHTIYRYVHAGRIARRHPLGRRTPSLSCESVEEFAEWWRAHLAEADQRGRPPPPPPGPPDDGEVWLDSVTASLVIGVSPEYLKRLAHAEKVPAVRDGRRQKWWFRRRDIEQFSAVRAYAKVPSLLPQGTYEPSRYLTNISARPA